MAVDYGAGASSAIANQYESLRLALADKGAAENLREARNIERKGLFGTGIRTSDIRDLTSAGLSVAEFGQTRMEGQMDRAEKSFSRRQAADERRLATLQKRADKGGLDKSGYAEMDGIQMGMTERRDTFEDTLSKYRDKGLWGSGFGSKGVGYRTEGESKYSIAERGRDGKIGEGAGQGTADTEHMRRRTLPPAGTDPSGRFRSDIPAGTDPSVRQRQVEEDRAWDRLSKEDDIREKYLAQIDTEYDKRLPKNPKFRSSGVTESEYVSDYLGGGRKGTDDKYAPDWMTGRNKFKGSPISEDYLAKPFAEDTRENELDRMSREGMMNIEPLDFSDDRLPPGVTRERLRELGYGA